MSSNKGPAVSLGKGKEKEKGLEAPPPPPKKTDTPPPPPATKTSPPPALSGDAGAASPLRRPSDTPPAAPPRKEVPPRARTPPIQRLPAGTSDQGAGNARGPGTRPVRPHRPADNFGGFAKSTSTAWDEIPDDLDDRDLEFGILEELPPDEPWNDTDVCANYVAPDYTLSQFLQDLNGSSGFSEDKAAIGTILVNHYLQVTEGLVIPHNFVLGGNPFLHDGILVTSRTYQERVALFMYANYRALMDSGSGLSKPHAWFLVQMRLNVVIAGGTAEHLPNRAVYVDEYAPNHLHLADIDWTEFEIPPGVADYVNSYWLQYVALIRHLFITRGHHYKDEYLETIERTWAATTITAPPGLSVPTWQHTLRTALHCFGVRALHLLVAHGRMQGKLAASYVVRYNAAPAGTAPIRTGWAAIENMKQAHWWTSFYRVYGDRVDALEDANNKAVRLGLRGHVNAKLFNWSWSTLNLPDTPVRPLAPYILGFLDTLDRRESIRNQQSLTKRGDGGSAIRAAFMAVILNDQQNAAFLRTTEEFFARARQQEDKEPSRAA